MATGNTDKNANHKLGHRSRLRDRYLENGIDALAEHEILEFLLFYAIPRTDTKPIAYRLIDEFGSLKGVLNAPYDSLISFGLTSACASYIRMLSDVPEWIFRHSIKGEKITGYNEIGNIFLTKLRNEPMEKVAVLILDAKDRIVDLRIISEGSFSDVTLDMRKIAEICLSSKAAKVYLAHNHPGEKFELSPSDYACHNSLTNLFSKLDIEYPEHYIISGDTFFGMNKHIQDSASYFSK